MLREFITQEERLAYHSSTEPNLEDAKHKFNDYLKSEIHMKIVRYTYEKQLSLIDKIITHKEVLCKKIENEYEILGLLPKR